MSALLQALATGTLIGGLYALVGVGLSMIFGIMKLTNLAHSDIMVMSAFFTVYITRQFIASPVLALLITIIIMLPIGILIQKFLINKVIDQGTNAPLLVTFGLSVAIQNGLQIIFGSGAHGIDTELLRLNLISTPIIVSAQYVINFIVAVVVIGGLALIMNKTSLGRAVRASSSNTKAAELMGVNTKRMYIYAMCLTMIVTSIAGMILSSSFVLFHYSGSQYLIIAFGVVVIGGMGSIIGTLIGGIIMGLAQLVGGYIFGNIYQLHCGFVALLIVLASRPQGLFSKAVRK